MAKFMYDENGKVYLVHAFEEVNPDEIQARIDSVEKELAAAKQAKVASEAALAKVAEQPGAGDEQPKAPAVPEQSDMGQVPTPEMPAAPVAPEAAPVVSEDQAAPVQPLQ